jgi:hypothetical protein
MGAVLTAGLAYELPRHVPASALAGTGGRVTQLVQSPATLNQLKHTHPQIHEGIIQAYSHAIDRVFLIAVPISLLSVVAALFVKQSRLRDDDGRAVDPAETDLAAAGRSH